MTVRNIAAIAALVAFALVLPTFSSAENIGSGMVTVNISPLLLVSEESVKTGEVLEISADCHAVEGCAIYAAGEKIASLENMKGYQIVRTSFSTPGVKDITLTYIKEGKEIPAEKAKISVTGESLATPATGFASFAGTGNFLKAVQGFFSMLGSFWPFK